MAAEHQQVMAGGKPTDGGPKIPQQLRELGARRKPNPPSLARCRILLLGRPKDGKTTLIGSDRRNFIISIGGGAHSIAKQRAPVIEVRDYSHCEEVIATLIALKGTKDIADIETIWIDTGPHYLEMLGREITNEYNEGKPREDHASDIGEVGWEGSGWGKMRTRFVARLAMIYEAGFGWGVTGHIVDREVQDAATKQTQVVSTAAFSPKVREWLYAEPELIMTLTKVSDEREKKRIIRRGGRDIAVDDGVERLTKYYVDLRNGNSDPGVGGSRVAIDEVIELQEYKDGKVPSRTNWEVVEGVYEKARQKLIKG